MHENHLKGLDYFAAESFGYNKGRKAKEWRKLPTAMISKFPDVVVKKSNV